MRLEKVSRGEKEPLIWLGLEKLVSRLALPDLAPLVRDALVDKATSSKRLLGFKSLSRG